MGRKRNRDTVSPSDAVSSTEKPVVQTKSKRTKKNKMAANKSPTNVNAQIPASTPVSNTDPGQQNHTPYMLHSVLPQMYPFSPFMNNMNASANASSPLQQQLPPSVINSDPLNRIIEKLEHIDTKLGQLDSIQLAVHDITVRLDEMDTKICHIEKSQSFLSDQYETISSCTNVNKKNIHQIQCELERLKNENMSLQKASENFSEAVIDLKCRSMRDNLMFFGISENELAPCVQSGNPSSAANGSGQSIEPINQLSEDGTFSFPSTAPMGSRASESNDQCINKVHSFCESVLGIKSAKSKIRIIRAHRVGRPDPNKPRPLVAKLDEDSKQLIKSKLKSVNLRSTPYHVTDQFPPEVQERRRALIPVMLNARKEGKKAVLVRDKLYINNRLYDSGSSSPTGK